MMRNLFHGKLSKVDYFVLAIAAAYLAPFAIPSEGIDPPYFFIMVLVLFAWFAIKWGAVKALTSKGSILEIAIGSILIAADYALNIFRGSRMGLLDMLLIFSSLALAFYGIKSFKLFWVPATYGIVLLSGYTIEAYVPNFVVLQNWMANIMVSSVRVLGIGATVSGHIVTLNSAQGPLQLNVESDCTGIQGILAFGMLSSMAILDIKAKVTRLVPLLVLGFVGAFMINIVRLFGVFLSFEFLGVSIGGTVHVYLGYLLFVVWVMVFWSLAFKYLMPKRMSLTSTSTFPANAAPVP